MISTNKSQHFLSRFDEYGVEQALTAGAVGAGVGAVLAGGHHVKNALVKSHVRKKYGLHNHIHDYKLQRHNILAHPHMNYIQKKHAIHQHHQETLHTITQHIAHQNGGDHRKAYHSAQRALHGEVFDH